MLKIIMNYLCIVPVFNEEERLSILLEEINKFKKKNEDINFLIIDNGSNDKSNEIIKKYNFNLITNKKNHGVGYALIQGYKYAKKNKIDVLIHLAGNGKMKPDEIPNFVKMINQHNYDFVNGSRFLPTGNYKNNPIMRVLLIKILTKIISFIYNRRITDATCGFRAFKCSVLESLIKHVDSPKYYTYRYEYYSLGKILINKKINFTEVPVTMDYKKKNYSKIRPIIDWFPIIFGWLEALIDGKKF